MVRGAGILGENGTDTDVGTYVNQDVCYVAAVTSSTEVTLSANAGTGAASNTTLTFAPLLVGG